MTKFEKAIEFTLSEEGGYINDPIDPGGETKYGISKRAYPKEDIKNLTKIRAVEIYKRDYWIACSCEAMPENVAMFVFDFSVNSGISVALKTFQKALKVKADGKIGPMTLQALGMANLTQIMRSMVINRLMYYASLQNFPRYKATWIGRTIRSLNII